MRPERDHRSKDQNRRPLTFSLKYWIVNILGHIQSFYNFSLLFISPLKMYTLCQEDGSSVETSPRQGEDCGLESQNPCPCQMDMRVCLQFQPQKQRQEVIRSLKWLATLTQRRGLKRSWGRFLIPDLGPNTHTHTHQCTCIGIHTCECTCTLHMQA